MTVKQVAIIYLALAKFTKNSNLSFSDAMNIVKLKNQLRNYFEIVVDKEKYIVNTYGKRDDKGNLVTENDNPVFVDTEESKKALVGLRELYDQKIEDEISKIDALRSRELILMSNKRIKNRCYHISFLWYNFTIFYF